MKTCFTLTAGVVCAGIFLAATVDSPAVTFSLDPGSVSIGGIPAAANDILVDPGGPGAATVILAGGFGGFGNVDAFSYGEVMGPDLTHIHFSVDPGSTGIAGSAVMAEAAGAGAPGPGDQPADVYTSFTGMSAAVPGTNVLSFDGNGMPNPGGAPNLGLVEPTSAGPADNIDGLDLKAPAIGVGPIFWSIDPGTVGAIAVYMSAADIYVDAPMGAGFFGFPTLYASEAALGLGMFGLGDDIDAIEIFDDGDGVYSAATDLVVFSLVAGSPTLLAFGLGGADVFAVGAGIGAVPVLAASALSLGLSPTDEIDALDLDAVPEPSRMILLALGLTGLLLRRRR